MKRFIQVFVSFLAISNLVVLLMLERDPWFITNWFYIGHVLLLPVAALLLCVAFILSIHKKNFSIPWFIIALCVGVAHLYTFYQWIVRISSV